MKSEAQRCAKTSWSQKEWCNKPTKLQLQSILNMENVYAFNRINWSWPENLAASSLGVSLVHQKWLSPSWWNMRRNFNKDVYTISNLILKRTIGLGLALFTAFDFTSKHIYIYYSHYLDFKMTLRTPLPPPPKKKTKKNNKKQNKTKQKKPTKNKTKQKQKIKNKKQKKKTPKQTNKKTPQNQKLKQTLSQMLFLYLKLNSCNQRATFFECQTVF